jgi:hypothetical protein
MTGKPAIALLILAAAGAGLLLAACAEPARVQWHKAGTSADDWERDQASCRYRARRAADREFRATPPEQDASLLGGRSALERDMAVYDAQRRQRQIFEDCLRNLGYAPDSAGKK